MTSVINEDFMRKTLTEEEQFEGCNVIRLLLKPMCINSLLNMNIPLIIKGAFSLKGTKIMKRPLDWEQMWRSRPFHHEVGVQSSFEQTSLSWYQQTDKIIY